MIADKIISRLEGVREVAPDRYMAKCPGHEDKTPSLSIREIEGGRVLLHCFAGCDAPDVLAAIGLSLSDLYPTPPKNHDGKSKQTRPGHWHMANVALRKIKFEALLVAIAAENIAGGITLSDEDRERVIEAAGRIRAAAEVVG